VGPVAGDRQEGDALLGDRHPALLARQELEVAAALAIRGRGAVVAAAAELAVLSVHAGVDVVGAGRGERREDEGEAKSRPQESIHHKSTAPVGGRPIDWLVDAIGPHADRPQNAWTPPNTHRPRGPKRRRESSESPSGYPSNCIANFMPALLQPQSLARASLWISSGPGADGASIQNGRTRPTARRPYLTTSSSARRGLGGAGRSGIPRRKTKVASQPGSPANFASSRPKSSGWPSAQSRSARSTGWFSGCAANPAAVAARCSRCQTRPAAMASAMSRRSRTKTIPSV